MITEEVKRVFFHELGHFVASEINSKYFGSFNTESIEITFPCQPKFILGGSSASSFT